MKKILLTSLFLFYFTNITAASHQSLAAFGKMLKIQQAAIAKSCEKDLLDNNPRLNAAGKQQVKNHCLCVAKTTSANDHFIKKMYAIAQHSRSQVEYVSKMEKVGSEIAQYCQQHFKHKAFKSP